MSMEEEPKDVIVLNAILKGKDEEKKISKHTGLSMFEVVSTVERLIARGFIIREEKKGLLGKKYVLKLTEKGYKELENRRYELEQKWQRMVELANQGNKQVLQTYVEDNRDWIWPMMMLGIMDMMMFMSMMSLMDLAMNNFIPDISSNDVVTSDGNGNVNDFGDLGDISF